MVSADARPGVFANVGGDAARRDLGADAAGVVWREDAGKGWTVGDHGRRRKNKGQAQRVGPKAESEAAWDRSSCGLAYDAADDFKCDALDDAAHDVGRYGCGGVDLRVVLESLAERRGRGNHHQLCVAHKGCRRLRVDLNLQIIRQSFDCGRPVAETRTC